MEGMRSTRAGMPRTRAGVPTTRARMPTRREQVADSEPTCLAGAGRTLRAAGLAAILALAVLVVPFHAQAQTEGSAADEAAVLGVVNRLFDGMREKDEAKLRSVFHDEARLHSAGVDEAGAARTSETPIDGFIRNVVGSSAHLDEVTFDERVEVSGNLAMAWTPYNLFVNDSFQHCGVDVFVMTRSGDGWRILQLADTRTQEGCDRDRRD